MTIPIDDTRALSDDALLARVRDLASRERGTTTELIAHLAEVEARDLHLKAGYSSMYSYCRGALMLSEHAAYHRIEAARAARHFPMILGLLSEGAVNLTTVKLLARHLTEENHRALLESARGASRSEVEQLVARLAPMPDVPTIVRKLPPPRPASGSTRTEELVAAGSSPATSTPLVPPPASPAPEAPQPPRVEHRPAVVGALSPDRYKLQLTIGGDTLEKLRLAQDMLRHAIPSGDEAQILDRALALLLANLANKKFAVTPQPRPGATRSDGAESRHVPSVVRRAVFVRDRGRCAFVSRDGRRCNERSCLELHHVRPYSEGGPTTVANIQLRCRAHNGYEWRLRSSVVRKREEEWHVQRLDSAWAEFGGRRPARP